MHVARHELRGAFRKHLHAYRTAGGGATASHRLLLAYAVECGLKLLIMMDQIAESTLEISLIPDLGWMVQGTSGHDISRLANKAGYPAPPSLVLDCVPLGTFTRQAESRTMHLVWRYGVAVQNEPSELAVAGTLETIAKWIEEELSL